MPVFDCVPFETNLFNMDIFSLCPFSIIVIALNKTAMFCLFFITTFSINCLKDVRLHKFSKILYKIKKE